MPSDPVKKRRKPKVTTIRLTGSAACNFVAKTSVARDGRKALEDKGGQMREAIVRELGRQAGYCRKDGGAFCGERECRLPAGCNLGGDDANQDPTL